MSGRARPALLVAIDTEGDNQWDAARAAASDVREHLRARPAARVLRAPRRAADLRHHAPGRDATRDRPTCCAACSRAATARSARTITPGKRRRARPTTSTRHPYALSLPLAQFDAQLASLTDGDHRRPSASRPVSYRSGRFGFSAAHVSSLERQGYLVDSSVAPLFYEAHKQGPDFVGAPLDAVLSVLRRRDAARARATLLELPISAALNRRVPAVVERWYGRAPWPYTTKRVLRLLRIAHVRWLRPSYSSAEDMIALARQIVGARRADPEPAVPLERSDRRRQPVQPHARRSSTRSSIGCRPVLTYATRELGAEPMTFAEFRRPVRRRAGRAPGVGLRTRRPMRICHVSPHLPPDQAANALLPAELGRWARARGDDVTFVAHEPAQGRAAHGRPGRAGRAGCRAASAAGAVARLLRIDTLAARASIGAALDRMAAPTPTCSTCTATG